MRLQMCLIIRLYTNIVLLISRSFCVIRSFSDEVRTRFAGTCSSLKTSFARFTATRRPLSDRFNALCKQCALFRMTLHSICHNFWTKFGKFSENYHQMEPFWHARFTALINLCTTIRFWFHSTHSGFSCVCTWTTLCTAVSYRLHLNKISLHVFIRIGHSSFMWNANHCFICIHAVSRRCQTDSNNTTGIISELTLISN